VRRSSTVGVESFTRTVPDQKLRNEMMPMHLIIDLARDLAIVAIELLVLISLGWCLSRKSAGNK
jgi:hypothetical protein